MPKRASVKTSIHPKNASGLRLRLKKGAKERAQRDLELAEECFDLEEEASPRGSA